MQPERKTKSKVEFGDFQTPLELAAKCCDLLAQRGFAPASILEPTCGRGNFLAAALQSFPPAVTAVGVEINPDHVTAAQRQVQSLKPHCRVEVVQESFFAADWQAMLNRLPDPLLIVGNPPWVTNSQLGAVEGQNLPRKVNFQNLHGIDALTGKSNFDISEWMLLRALEWINQREAMLAVLCKTTVARKVLTHAWKNQFHLARTDIYRIDARKWFGAAVDACWLVIETSPQQRNRECADHDGLNDGLTARTFGFRDGHLIADLAAYASAQDLIAKHHASWRSGIKHDCAKVLELELRNGHFHNGLGEEVRIEPHFLYPMLKSSEVAAEGDVAPRKWMLVTQRSVGEETKAIRWLAPQTWRYLLDHEALLAQRASSIYRGQPKFSVFGVGPYSFTPWKVAVSGFYKKLSFRAIGPHAGKPVVLDDTCCFLACANRSQAETLAGLLNSAAAGEFFSAFIFWDAKRPITIDLLRKLNLSLLAERAGLEGELVRTLSGFHLNGEDDRQGALFR